MSDSDGDRPVYSAAADEGTETRLQQEARVYKVIKQKAGLNIKKSQQDFFNTVNSSSVTAILFETHQAFDQILKITVSSTATSRNREPGLLYGYFDTGGNGKEIYGINGYGINVAGFGARIGTDTKGTIHGAIQIGPLIHAESSLRHEGIGLLIGLDINNTTYDIEFQAGWGLLLPIIGAYWSSTGSFGESTFAPAPIPGLA